LRLEDARGVCAGILPSQETWGRARFPARRVTPLWGAAKQSRPRGCARKFKVVGVFEFRSVGGVADALRLLTLRVGTGTGLRL